MLAETTHKSQNYATKLVLVSSKTGQLMDVVAIICYVKVSKTFHDAQFLVLMHTFLGSAVYAREVEDADDVFSI